MQSITTISQKGQIVVPKEIRDQLKLKPSDVLSVTLKKDEIVVKPLPSDEDIFGMFKTKTPVTKKDIKDSYRQGIDQKHK